MKVLNEIFHEIPEVIKFQQMQIIIKLGSGQTINVDVGANDTVAKLKAVLKQKDINIPIDQLGLVYAGKQLSDEQTLAQCGIQKEAVIQAVAKKSADKKEDKPVEKKEEKIPEKKQEVASTQKSEPKEEAPKQQPKPVETKKDNPPTNPPKTTTAATPLKPATTTPNVTPKPKLVEEIPYRPSLSASRLLVHFDDEIFPVYTKEGQSVKHLKDIFVRTLQATSKRSNVPSKPDQITLTFADGASLDESWKLSVHSTTCDVFAHIKKIEAK